MASKGDKDEAAKRELRTKVKKLVDYKFEGKYKKAFDHYDKNRLGKKDGKVDSDSLKQSLKDADVGNGFTRGLWVKAIIKTMDTDKDGAISWGEFESVFENKIKTGVGDALKF